MPKIFEWAKSHPVEAGGVVFVGGIVVLYMLGFFSGGSSSSGGNASDADAYYAAESAQGQAGDALQAVQIQAQAQTAQTLIAAQSTDYTNNVWATTDLATQQSNNATSITETASNNATAIKLAPYETEAQLIQTLGGVASQPGGTSTSSNSGFFGIGASSNTTYNPNPAAVNASNLLDEWFTSLSGDGFHAST